MNDLRDALNEFESLLVSLGFPPGLGLTPGLSPEEIQQVSDKAGIPFPTELVTWYRWKNGDDVIIDEYYRNLRWEMFGGNFMTSTRHALFRHEQESWIAEEIEMNEPYLQEQGFTWDKYQPDLEKGVFWEILINGMGDVLYADIAADPHVCPVYATYKAPHDQSLIPVPLLYRSLNDMMRTMISCYAEGAYRVVHMEGVGLTVDTDDLEEGRIHREMNPGLPYWEDYCQFALLSSQRSGN